jgi:hypothetical protein
MTTWPATLPAPLINTFQEAMPDNLIRTQMDKGPAVVRRRTTANVKAIGYDMILTSSQMDDLDTFFNTTAASGVDAFTYTHPRTGDTVSARFASPPNVSDVNGIAWRVSVALEVLP